jgi:class 3 adenylate cyclase/tetratricopeptide (TPR) repeat protein
MIPESAAAPPAGAREERRWATVLFADVAGFTALAERMDPEDVKSLAARCAEMTGEEVRRFGGTIITVLGDATMAVFGAPVAHEDDAERAVRAALAMRDRIGAIPAPRPLQLHVGINTGVVMAGLVGPEGRRDYTAMGDTTNIAARLMSAAAAGSVYVGEETYLASRRAVTYREIGAVAAKGKERTVLAWDALSAATHPPPRPLGTAPLVGRDRELTILADMWARASGERRPNLVTVLGEPGVGKSRLAAEFERRTLAGSRVLHGRCLPYGEALGYWAFAMMLMEAAAIAADDAPDVARTKLDGMVAHAVAGDADPRETAEHLALLLGLDAGEATAPADQRTLHGTARRFVEALARRGPLCLVFEDIHWADDALLDLIELLAARAQDVPLLVLAQARPELLEKRPSWGGGVRAFTSMALEPLDEDASRALVGSLCRERGLSDEIAEQAYAGAEGNPLFAEEIVGMIIERGPGAGIPSTIKGLITARLDALPTEERSCIQHAAVFGKSFWANGLGALWDSGDIAGLLEHLERKDLVRAEARSQFRGDRQFSFKHDLIRDVAYETLPHAQRRKLHARVADWIEHAAGERVEEFFDQLAHHALRADQQDRALDFLIGAAKRARRAAAHREEASLLAKAIEIAQATGRDELIPELLAARGKAFGSVAMWPDARLQLEAALAALPADAIERRAEVMNELATVIFWMLDVPGLRRVATEALELAQTTGRDDLAAGATGWLSGVASAEGDMGGVVELARRAIRLAGGKPIASLGNYPLSLYWSGIFEEGATVAAQIVEAARAANDTLAVIYSMPHLGLAFAGAGRYAEAQRVFEEACAFGREFGIGPMLARATAMSAGFHLDLFDYETAEAIQQEAREAARSLTFPPPLVSASIDLMLNLARRHDPGPAEALIGEVAETISKAGGWHGWLWKIRFTQARVELALERGEWEEARETATDSIAQSRARRRVKYEVLGLEGRARALVALGRAKEALADLRAALDAARRTGDPAMFVRPALGLLAIDGDEALAAETRATLDRIRAALPTEDMRASFEGSETVRSLEKLTR